MESRLRALEPYYTPEEVAHALQVTRRTVYDWLRVGRLRAVRVGKFWRVTQADVDAFLKPEPGPPVVEPVQEAKPAVGPLIAPAPPAAPPAARSRPAKKRGRR